MVHSANNISLLDLSQLPDSSRYYVAFSGGMDSTALLFELIHHSPIRDKITAIHVNHNINPKSYNWATHCQSFCDRFNIPLINKSVELTDHSENSCRKARQEIYQKILNSNDCLITGHHLNDQVETVLFRLIRGSGLKGLTGMSTLSKYHHYLIFRPMLHCGKEKISSFITNLGLNYIEDPSNSSNDYTRNFIRNELLPLIKTRYPQVINNISLTTRNLSQSLKLLNTLINKSNPLITTPDIIKNNDLFSTQLYHWLTTFNIEIPNHHALNQFANDCINAQTDKIPHLLLPQVHLKFWKQKVYALVPRSLLTLNELEVTLISNQPFFLPQDLGSIELKSKINIELKVTVKFQQQGEKIQLNNKTFHSKVKNIFQSNNIPPWERKVIPYVYIDGNLMSIGSQFISNDFQLLLNQINADFHWLSPQFLL